MNIERESQGERERERDAQCVEHRECTEKSQTWIPRHPRDSLRHIQNHCGQLAFASACVRIHQLKLAQAQAHPALLPSSCARPEATSRPRPASPASVLPAACTFPRAVPNLPAGGLFSHA